MRISLRYGFWTYAILMALCVPSALLRAYVLAQCWTWFVTPLGAPAVTQAHVYGLGALLSMVTYQAYVVKDEDIADAGEVRKREATGIEKFLYAGITIAQAVFPTLIGWGFAAIAHTFMPS